MLLREYGKTGDLLRLLVVVGLFSGSLRFGLTPHNALLALVVAARSGLLVIRRSCKKKGANLNLLVFN